MANVCPLKFLPGGVANPDWTILVDQFGEAGAQTAFAKNNYTIPTPKRAQSILEKLRVQEPENRFNESSPEFKLERNKAQRTYIDEVMTGNIVSKNPLQLATLGKIRDITTFYNEILSEEISARDAGQRPARTISVTNFIGSTDYQSKEGDFEGFKLFGTFMHNLLDSLQNEATIKRSTSQDLLSREYFDAYWKKTPTREQFTITGMPLDTVFEMAQRLAATITTESYKNYVILPELTLAAKNHTGSVIVGRLDLLLIDSDGNAIVYDFKTKKVRSLIEEDAMGVKQINTDAARAELASKEWKIDKKTGQTASEFQQTYRTPYDTWVLQLKTYENMLRQHGVNVKNSTIISLMYQSTDGEVGKPETKVFEGYALQIFDGNNFYASAGIDATDINGHVVEVEKKARKLDVLRAQIDALIPISLEQQEASQAQLVRTFPFDTTADQNQKLEQALKDRVDADMRDVERQIHDLKGQEDQAELLEMLTRRRETLKTFRDIVEMPESTWGPSMKLKQTVERIEVDIKSIDDLSTSSLREWEAINKKSEQELTARDIERKKELLVLISKTYDQAQDINPVFLLVKDVVDQAIRDENTDITLDSNISRLMIEMGASIGNVEAAFKQVALRSTVEMFKMLGEERFRQVDEKMRMGLEPKIRLLEQEIEDLNNGMPPGLFSQAGVKLMSFFNKDYREKAAAMLSTDDLKRRAGHIEFKKLKLEKMKFLAGMGTNGAAFEFTDENLTKYIEGVANPSSIMYIGQSDLYDDFFTMRADQFMAGAANSDMGLAALTIMLKEAQALGTKNMMDQFEETRVQEKLDALMNGRTVDQANKAVSEIRTIQYKDKDGNVISRNERTYVKLVSVAYEQALRDFRQNSRELQKKVKDLKDELNRHPLGSAERKDVDTQLNEAISEREKEVDRYNTWQEEHCSRPFVDEFYTIQNMIGAEFREKLQKKYLQMDLIVRSVGLGNEELLIGKKVESENPEEEVDLDADMYDRMRELAIEIKELRIEASKVNPDWSDYMEKLDEFFEYEPNMNLFNRIYNRKKIEYADNPEMLAKWEEENLVITPNELWGQKIEGIYARMGELFSKDVVMSEMIERRSQIMAPYRRDGRFDPTYLTKRDADLLSQLEYDLNRYKQGKKEEREDDVMDDVEKQELFDLINELQGLSTSTLNPHYQRNMAKKTTELMKRKTNLEDAKRALAVAEANGTEDEIAAARASLQTEETTFSIYEKTYREWHDMSHNNKYVSVRKGPDPRDGPQPRSFNYEKLPPADKQDLYMDKPKPSGRWNIRKNKDAVNNLNYQESPDGMALPKGISYDQATQKYMVDETQVARDENGTPLYVNPKYIELTQDSAAFDFYNTMMPEFFKLQRQTTGSKIGYRVPGYEATLVENVARLGASELAKRTWKGYLDEKVKGNSEYDQVTNFYGDSGDRLRFRHNRQMSEELQSADSINCLVKWMSEAHYNKSMANAQPMTDAFINYMKLMRGDVEKQTSERTVGFEKRLLDLNNIIGLMENERNKFIKGQFAEPGNKQVRKVMNQVFQFTSFARIGFDLANQAKNYIAGNVQAFLAAGASSASHYSDEDLRWAKGQIYGQDGFFSKYLTDWGNISGLSVETMLYRAFNPAQKDYQKYLENTTGDKTRRLLHKVTSIQELAYGLQDKGDTEIAMTVWLAIMHHNRFRVIESRDPETGKAVYALNPDGSDKTVNALEAYFKDPKTGKLQIRPDVEYTSQNESVIRHQVYSNMRKAQGNYAKSDQTKNEAGLFGPMINYFRKYMVSQALTRLGHLRPDWEGSGVHYGYFRVMLAAFKYYGPQETAKHLLLGGFTPKWIKNSQMNDLYSSKVAHASRDLIMSSILMMLSLYAMSIVKQRAKDDDELGMIEGNLIRILWSVKNETISMNPIPVFGGTDEYIKSFTSLTSLTKEFTGLSKILGHGLGMAFVAMNGGEEPSEEDEDTLYAIAYKSAFYQRDQGGYEKGDPKFYKDLADASGYKNISGFFNPGERIDNLKKLE